MHGDARGMQSWTLLPQKAARRPLAGGLLWQNRAAAMRPPCRSWEGPGRWGPRYNAGTSAKLALSS